MGKTRRKPSTKKRSDTDKSLTYLSRELEDSLYTLATSTVEGERMYHAGRMDLIREIIHAHMKNTDQKFKLTLSARIRET